MSGRSDPLLTAEDLEEIFAILDGSAYDSLELSTSGFTLRINREDGGWTRESETRGQANLAETQVAPAGDSATAATGKAGTAPSQDGLVDVPAPMMGTLYRAPKPGAAPFVEIGSRVEADNVIAIIEVMKLMNSIRAEVTGEVIEICVENGQAIEQGQVLIRVKPDDA
jgi:acetyl-CoA carboxylase biotin carboxyl carrier protein